MLLSKKRPPAHPPIPPYILLLCLLAGWVPAAHAQQAANVHGAFTIDVDCAACHQTAAWKPLRAHLDFDHDRQTPFPLTGRHAEASCAGCHLDLRFDAPEVEENDCASCHVDVHQGEFPGRCVDCHTTNAFQEVEGLVVHNRTRFPLTGAHVQVTCESCHRTDEGGAFSTLDTECVTCHEPEYEAAHGAAGFPTTCTNCHTTLAWAAAPPFDHATLSGGFALLGVHEPLACLDCHQAATFQPIFAPVDQDDCIACHQQDYEQQHAGSGFPTTCTNCHTVDAWQGATFDHALATNGFGLVGAHEALDCAACHGPPPALTPLFSPVDENDCLTCHQPDFESAHAGSGFPITCLTCHNVEGWEGAVFEHGGVSNGFAMLGAHQQLPCSACHQGSPDFTPLFTPVDQDDCFACHQQNYEQQHAGGGFPTTCLACHTVDTWEDAVFDHALAANGFGLVGAHEALDCAACHGPPPGFDPLFTPVDENDCLACHQPDFESAHAGSGFPTTCLDCHTVDAWEGAVFDHALAANGFGLVGAHEPLPCAACHQAPPGFTPLFAPVDQDDCIACHQQDYQQQHAADGFPTQCLACHSVDTWDDATVDHAALADGFGLVGAHEALDCAACHGPPPDLTPLFTPVDQDDCIACHQQDYQQQHAGSGFPTACTDCHSVDTWEGAVFNHAAVADGFGLIGAHDALDCAACHGPPPDFTPLFTPNDEDDCVACHQPDFQAAHAGSGFPTTCQTCHNAEDWRDATFEHADVASGFALIGAHDQLPCLACHQPPPGFDPLFTPVDQDDCIACHQQDYQQQHAGSGFPTACTDCHTVDTWSGATFDHEALADFALVGAHDALDCSACHGPPPDLTPLFSPDNEDDCYACHQDDYQREHGGSGFPTTCTDCHNNTDWDDADFDHDDAFFPIFSGRHNNVWNACTDCHTDPGNFSLFSCLTCHEHNQADMDEEHDDVPGYVYASSACLSCHPNGEED